MTMKIWSGIVVSKEDGVSADKDRGCIIKAT